MPTIRSLVAAVAALALTAAPALAQFQTVNIGGVTNDIFAPAGVINGTTYPSGATTLGGVPFLIDQDVASAQARGWFANTAAGGGNGPVSVTVPVGVFGVTSVYTLINTFWGADSTLGTFANLTFTGSGGATFTKYLFGNADVRDYNFNPNYTTGINGTTTVEVFNNNVGQHLDRQMIVLPAAFATETLTSVTLNDVGASGFQRTFLAGVTVGVAATTTPEPATFALVGGGLALVGLVARRRRTS